MLVRTYWSVRLFIFVSTLSMAGSPESRHNSEAHISHEESVFSRTLFFERRIRAIEDVDAQKLWQTDGERVHQAIRAQLDSIAFAQAQGMQLPVARALGLPRTDALMRAISTTIADPAYQSDDTLIQKMIGSLKNARGKDGTVVNVLDVLTSPSMSATQRWNWWKAELEDQLEYCITKDRAELRDEQKLVEQSEEIMRQDPSFELPPLQSDEMRTSMDELGESKEGESRGYFSVHPFLGGYYREEVFETHAGGSKWRKEARSTQEVVEQDVGTLEERRVFRGVVRGGAVTSLPIPYVFIPDISSLRATENAVIVQDNKGMWCIDTRASKGNVSFTIEIGIPRTRAIRAHAEPATLAVADTYVSAQTQPIIDGLSGSVLEKARALKRYVQQMLEYSNESSLNAVYENYPTGYFAAIEEYKKADCDVANAYYINLLSAAGIHARMATGHYVKMKDANGAALMNSGTRHAWTEVWDTDQKAWVRFDATPAKDPTLDEERPDEQTENETGPGDYGEQEAHILSEEELEELREKINKEAEDAQLKDTPQRERDFVKETGCTPEEAAVVLKKIEEARKIRDSKGRVIRTALGQEFTKVVESNYKEVLAFKGPVKRSEGDEMDDLVMIGKDVQTGSTDPLGYVLEAREVVRKQEYGGLDLYIAADRSESMKEIDPVSGNQKKDEQQVTLFLLEDSLFAFSEKTRLATLQNQLISPLSVRSAVYAFQAGSTAPLKELGPTWRKQEWLDLWKGLESNIGGGTPAHLALEEIRKRIIKDIEEEKKKRPPTKPRVRMVAVFMDGGVDNIAQYLAEHEALAELGVRVVPYGMTEAARAVEALPNGRCVPSVRGILEPVCIDIIDEAQKLMAKQGV